MEKVLNKYTFYILCFIPTFLVAGPAIPDIIISLTSLFFIYYSFKNGKYFFFKNKIFYCYFLFWLIIIFGSLLSENILFSLKNSFFHFRFVLFSFALVYIIENNKNFLTTFYKITLFTVILVVFDGFFQSLFKVNILGYAAPNDQRISGFFEHEWILGSYLVRILPILVGLYFLNNLKTKSNNFLFLISVAALSVLIFLSGERSAFFLLLVYFSILIIFLKMNNYFRLGIILFLIIFPMLLAFSSNIINDRMFRQTIISLGIAKLIPPTKNKNKEPILECCSFPKYFFSYGHTKHFQTAYEMFKDKPLLGHGVKSFRLVCHKYEIDFGCSTHPHNTYMQLLAETGIFGFLLVLLGFFYFCYLLIQNFIKRKKINISIYNARQCFLGAFLINLFPIITTGSFFTNWLSIMYFLPLGILISTYNYSDEFKKKE
jgi:hypothetical protein